MPRKVLKKCHILLQRSRMNTFLDVAKRRAARVQSVHDLNVRAGDLPRVLGVVDLTFLGLGSILGAGVYVLSGVTASSVAG
jgi:hypothetical protein